MSECDKRWSALALAKNYHLILTFPGPIKLSSAAGTLEEKERAPQLLPWSAGEELAVEKWEVCDETAGHRRTLSSSPVTWLLTSFWGIFHPTSSL